MSSSMLRMQHTSLQFKDSRRQQEHDIHTLFDAGGNFPIKTGTEAGRGKVANANREFLTKFAKEYNHAINFAADTWVAVDRSITKPRSVDHEDIFLADNKDMVGNGFDRIMATIAFDHVDDRIGRINVGSVHYPTRGARPGDPNHKLNIQCARRIHMWMKDVGLGPGLAFVNGDFNMPDRTTDWAIGGHFSSLADDLKHWQNTGHGPIDGFASFDRDGRVKAHRFNVLDDRELQMFSDHYICRGVWEIRHRKEKDA